MVTIASPTAILIISVNKPIISLVLISLRKRMTFSPLVIIGIFTDKYKNADMGKDIK
jgi:hypothetical protein